MMQSTKNYKLEVCVDNFQSALAAQAGGADRIELCSALDIGGVTPSMGFAVNVKRVLKIPVILLIRARGGDFVYNPEEICLMVEDINQGYHISVDGFAVGALKADGTIDKEACARFIKAARGIPVTFHRAFDVMKTQPIEEIINLGFKRILTSGRSKTAYEGMQEIKNLIGKAGKRISIMPGSGINPFNLKEIMETTGATEFHSSGLIKSACPVVEEAIVQGADFYNVTSVDLVKKMKKILVQ